MSDEEKPIDLRDKIAIEIFNGMLASTKSEHSSIWDLDSKNPSNRETAVVRVEKLIRNCYRTADIFRKVRLAAFE